MGALPWIKVAVGLPRHEKAMQLRIQTQEQWAWAMVVQLWMATSQHNPSGEFVGRGCEDIIEEWAGWRGKRGVFVEACVSCGFLDEMSNGYRVHDWTEWGGAHLEQKRKDRERKAKSRHADSPPDVPPDSPPDVPRKSRGRSKGSHAERPADGHADSCLKTQETGDQRSESPTDHDRPCPSFSPIQSSSIGLEGPTKHLIETEDGLFVPVEAANA